MYVFRVFWNLILEQFGWSGSKKWVPKSVSFTCSGTRFWSNSGGAAEKCQYQNMCFVLVLGPGPIGILCGLVAKVKGAEVAIAGLERDAKRLAVAESIGLQPLIGDVLGWARQVDGVGVHMAVDAAGVSATLRTALDAVRPKGRIVKVGWGPQPLDFSLDPLVQKNVALLGSFSHNRPIWEAVLGLLSSGVLNPSPILEGTWALHDWREAFEQMHDGDIVKAQLKPA